ncbi:MAG TPA: gliding motility-associated C-terminal domain-containing protein, partial [Flavobacterium sp.]|nr:gliding motility-associated C-terminal domain-containing protein [Flavobacterium sp.]
NAGTSGSITLCTTSPSIDLFTLLGNSPETGGTWSPALASGTGLFDPSVDTAGTYTYTIVGTPPCADSTATVAVTIDLAANAGVFTGIQIICNSTGNFDLNTLLDGTQQAGGVWVNGQGDTITNIISVTDLIAGTYTFVYTVTNTCNSDSEVVQLTIIQSPNITIDDVIVLTPICQGESTTITVFNLANGNYSINYSLTGSNILANQTVLLTVTDGEGSFTIDSTQLVNSGITTLILNSITNSVTTCTTVLSGLNFAIEVLPIPSISNSTIQIVNVCFGNDVLVQISGATNLTDGNYQFVYSIPNANPIIGNSGIISIVSGNGQFAITATVFPLAGVYTMSLISISNLATNCTNLNPNVAVTFEILAQPTITEALVSMAGICVNTEGTVLITNANNLSDGTYQLTYQISGAINFNETIPVVFTNGETSFVIPSSVTNNFGNITISINPINSNTGNACGFSGHTFNTVTIAIEEVETPQLIEGGNSFCEDDNSTIADLTNGIIGSETIIWYDAPSSGNAYSNSDLLVDGVTYYASIQSASGCESAVRLQVTVVIKDCTDIIIPDGFSPNGDGINEIFVINNIRTLYPNFTLEIFNRYGNILYKGNANSLDWDGTSDKGIQIGGNKLPVGVYFYVINFNDGSRKPLQGRVYLSR